MTNYFKYNDYAGIENYLKKKLGKKGYKQYLIDHKEYMEELEEAYEKGEEPEESVTDAFGNYTWLEKNVEENPHEYEPHFLANCLKRMEIEQEYSDKGLYYSDEDEEECEEEDDDIEDEDDDEEEAEEEDDEEFEEFSEKILKLYPPIKRYKSL